MFAKTLSATITGFDAVPVQVETDVGGGLPGFSLVGLPDASISESRERLRAAMKNSGFPLPGGRITVNLAPADIRKEGTALDLSIAISILAAKKILSPEKIEGMVFVGELSLNGELRHTQGVLPIALMTRKKELKGIVIPEENVGEAVVVPGLKTYAFSSLARLIDAFQANTPLTPIPKEKKGKKTAEVNFNLVDMESIKGQSFARRALEISAAGGHNIIFAGPPGAGKTLLAKSLPTILPQLSFDEALDVTRIYSIKGLLPPKSSLIRQRPFRDPHHTISDIAMIGGGKTPSPGEVSLAHHGVLFLDELPEFPRPVLEVLREPLTSGQVSISRANQTSLFPARFMLVAAMNPCPCGFSTDPYKQCICTTRQLRQYRQKISGPLLDRIDIQVQVPRLLPEELIGKKAGETSNKIRKRVEKARKIQIKRNAKYGFSLNSYIPAKKLSDLCSLNNNATSVLLSAARKFELSARGYDKIIRIARTIADLANKKDIEVEHVAEALQYRTQDIFGKTLS